MHVVTRRVARSDGTAALILQLCDMACFGRRALERHVAFEGQILCWTTGVSRAQGLPRRHSTVGWRIGA